MTLYGVVEYIVAGETEPVERVGLSAKAVLEAENNKSVTETHRSKVTMTFFELCVMVWVKSTVTAQGLLI